MSDRRLSELRRSAETPGQTEAYLRECSRQLVNSELPQEPYVHKGLMAFRAEQDGAWVGSLIREGVFLTGAAKITEERRDRRAFPAAYIGRQGGLYVPTAYTREVWDRLGWHWS